MCFNTNKQTRTHTYMHTHAWRTQTHTRTHTHACTHTLTHTCTDKQLVRQNTIRVSIEQLVKISLTQKNLACRIVCFYVRARSCIYTCTRLYVFKSHLCKTMHKYVYLKSRLQRSLLQLETYFLSLPSSSLSLSPSLSLSLSLSLFLSHTLSLTPGVFTPFGKTLPRQSLGVRTKKDK